MVTRFDKAIVALVMAVLQFVNVVWGLPIPFTEEQLTVLISAVAPFLVFFIPNKTNG